MNIRLRGHHLFCLLGYRGKGYSEGFCVNMTAVYEQLRQQPDTVIEIIDGPDDICKAFPTDKPSHCQNKSVYQKDYAILQEVGLTIGSVAKWSDVCETVASRIVPDDINRLCSDCPWQPYGMCQEGIGHIRESRELRELPS
ncbi:hypothetical protein SAMN04487969_1075 [Paenibacillus algorifonticola]|uniref:DUF1284 domain-containing protein n=1 Tax=Paenibacillus algorifonticola TaxID=684063 RepID=A0A1I2DHG2_9BACL|nr:DUF1284 domain-containing protein [Paenibacillus algorifonticola]SFE79791.1 hypothetical protein SAMN04487969_1075 [Paenibacillus algorifonticola]